MRRILPDVPNETHVHNDTLTYDQRGRIAWARNHTTDLARRHWYTGNGSLAAMETTKGVGHWHEENRIDALGNLIRRRNVSATGTPSEQGYVYDHLGRLQETATDVGDITGGTEQVMEYDNAGNTTFMTEHLSGSLVSGQYSIVRAQYTRSYYGADQKLVRTQRATWKHSYAAGASYNDLIEDYRYDALGRRIAVRSRAEPRCESPSYCESTLTRYVWDGDQILYELRADGKTGAWLHSPWGWGEQHGRVGYIHGPGIDAPLGVMRMEHPKGDPNRSHSVLVTPHADWRGAYITGHEVNPSSWCPQTGCLDIKWSGEQRSAYLQVSSTGGFEGHGDWVGSLITSNADASGLLYRRNRYYDPSTGRWTQEDPIGLAGGLNLYGFAGGDPVNFSDPFGLCRKPRGLKKGEIGICIETFIAGPSAGVPRATADNREFSATGGSYRTSDRFIVQEDGNVRDDHTRKGRTFGFIPGIGRVSHSHTVDGGTTTISASANSRTLSPWPPFNINYDFTITVSGGDVSVSGTHDGFPSYEIWVYEVGKDPRLLHGHYETNVMDLRGCCDQTVP